MGNQRGKSVEKGRFFQQISRYFTAKNLSISLLGFASGLPIMMTLSTLTYWLSVYGVEKKTIGLASLLGIPYILKMFWAPLLDMFQLPFFSKMGRRKGWILFFQLILAIIFILLSVINPEDNPLLTGLAIFLLATASASQDIVIDAYRIDYLNADEQAYGSSSYLMMYRIGMLVMGAGVLALSDHLSWNAIFLLISLLFIIIFSLTLFIREPKAVAMESDKDIEEGVTNSLESNIQRFISGFSTFFQRRSAWLLLLFIICYKLPDAISGVMATNFYHDMGFTGTEIGAVTKIYGLIATMVGAFMVGFFTSNIGLYRTLIGSTILIGITNLAYLLILDSPSLDRLIIAITAENFIGGFSSALFIMFLSLLCDRKASATQYALLSALAALGVRLFGGGSGYLVDWLEWGNFFIATAFLFVPALIVLLFIKESIVAIEAEK